MNTVKRIQWILVVVALALAVLAWFKMDDSPVHAIILGGCALAVAVLLNIITVYLEKHEHTTTPHH